MRVAVLPTIRDFAWGAPGACMAALVEELAQNGHDVLWFVAPIDAAHPDVLRLGQGNVRVELLPPPVPNNGRLAALRTAVQRMGAPARTLASTLELWRPSHLFLSDGGTWTGLHGEFAEALEMMRGRYSLICHLNHERGAFSAADLARARALLAGAARVYFGSQWSLELTQRQVALAIPNARLFHYPLRIEPSLLPWPAGGPARLAMVNRLDSLHKGIDIAFQAIGELRDTHALHLTLYGQGFDEAYLRALCAHLRLGDLVTFAGHVDDIRRIWTREELLLLPSRYEGLGVAMVEAMALGRPVLRTPYGGAAEWIEDGVNGFLCAAAEPQLFRDALDRVLRERPHWPEIGRRAFESVRDRHPARPARAFLESLEVAA